MNELIDLDVKREEITVFAKRLFEKIIQLPQAVRPDTKTRTGIQVLIVQPFTRNLIIIKAGEPSEAAMYFATEKAVRSRCYSESSSMNSADESCFQFAGSITVEVCSLPGRPKNAEDLQVSVSGLRSEDDVFSAIMIAAKILDVSPVEVVDNVEMNDGILPRDIYNLPLCEALDSMLEMV